MKEKLLKERMIIKKVKIIGKEISKLIEIKSNLQAKWEAEKNHVDAIQKAKQDIETLKIEAEKG